jgi:RNA-binding protein YlmH
MEPEGSLPHSQVPATCLHPEQFVPEYQSRSKALVNISYQDKFSRWGVVSTLLNPQDKGSPLVGFPRLLI